MLLANYLVVTLLDACNAMAATLRNNGTGETNPNIHTRGRRRGYTVAQLALLRLLNSSLQHQLGILGLRP
jgi:hypothetical protein